MTVWGTFSNPSFLCIVSFSPPAACWSGYYYAHLPVAFTHLQLVSWCGFRSVWLQTLYLFHCTALLFNKWNNNPLAHLQVCVSGRLESDKALLTISMLPKGIFNWTSLEQLPRVLKFLLLHFLIVKQLQRFTIKSRCFVSAIMCECGFLLCLLEMEEI